MTDLNASDRDVNRAIRSWLHEDRHEDGSRIAGAVLDQVVTTRQRRATLWPARRFADMNTLAKVFVAAAAVVAVAIVGINLLPGNGSGIGGSQPSPSPSPSPSPTVAPTARPQPTIARLPASGPIEAGTYLLKTGESSIRVTFPAGWASASDAPGFRKHLDQPDEVIFSVYSPDINVWSDACTTENVPPRTGPTADDLIAALRAQKNSDVSEPAAVTIGGRPGVRLDISFPAGLDISKCNGNLRIWSNAQDSGDWLSFGGPGTYPVYIVEAPSGRIVLATYTSEAATATDRAELQAILDSIQIEPAQ